MKKALLIALGVIVGLIILFYLVVLVRAYI